LGAYQDRALGRESEVHRAFRIILLLFLNAIICHPFKVINIASHLSVKARKSFGQKYPAAFQEREREKERASWNQDA
jgi:hypothetical protein